MTSTRKTTANRRNAPASTGPKTASSVAVDVTVDESGTEGARLWAELNPAERVEVVTKAVVETFEAYEVAHSDGEWMTETVLELVTTGLENLRRLVEDDAEPEVSWTTPVVELQYPFPWAWDERTTETPWGRPLSGVVKADELPTMEAATTKAVEVFRDHRHLLVLQALTNRVLEWREKGLPEPTPGGPTYVLPQDLVEELDQATGTSTDPETGKREGSRKGQAHRRRLVDELARPFTLGGLELDLEDGVFVPLSEEAERWAKKRAEELGLEELPAFLQFEGTTESGGAYAGGILIRFRPLVVDADAREAFHPVEVGLYFGPDVDPSAWPEADRRDLLEALLKGLAEAARETTDETPETGTLSTLPTPRVGPARYLVEGRTRLDKRASDFVRHVSGMSLPRRWRSIRRWEDLVQCEVERLRADYGKDAFLDFRKVAKDRNARGPLLVRKYDRTGAEVVELSTEASEALLDAMGFKGFRRVDQDEDGVRREYLVKRFKASGGYVECRLSWYGMAGPLVKEWRDQEQDRLEVRRRETEGLLFEDLDQAERDRLDSALRMLGAVRDAQPVMDLILRRLGQNGQNPVHLPAWELRSLLGREDDPHGFGRVKGCLRALQEVRFSLKAAGLGRDLSRRVFGPFLADVAYEARGAGRHTDGDFYLQVSEGFVGCLRVFGTTHYKLKNAREVLAFDWRKPLDKDERAELSEGYIRGWSALLPHYYQARCFTPEQRRLLTWLERELTLRKDTTAPHRRAEKATPNDPDAGEPRRYRRDFCPLLKDGEDYYAALGHWKTAAAESGRKLTTGGGTRPTAKAGRHPEGLLSVMGYYLRGGPGAAEDNATTLKPALRDLRFVVEEELDGVVAVRLVGRWLTLDEAAKLHVDDLTKTARWFLFVPPDWRERTHAALEAHKAESSQPVRVTTDREVAKQAEAERLGERFTADPETPASVGLEGLPLRNRLHAARAERGLSQAEVAEDLGVSKMTVSRWEKGTKPIPEARVQEVLRWVETEASGNP